MNAIKNIMRIIMVIIKVLMKFSVFMLTMFLGAYLLAPMGTINSKNVDMTTFTNTPNDAMMMIFNSEYLVVTCFPSPLPSPFSLFTYFGASMKLPCIKHMSAKALIFSSFSRCRFAACLYIKPGGCWRSLLPSLTGEHIGASISRVIKNSRASNLDLSDTKHEVQS